MVCRKLLKALLAINLVEVSLSFTSGAQHSRSFRQRCFTRLDVSSAESREVEFNVWVTTASSSERLPPLPCPKSNPADDNLRFLQSRLPISLQNFLRDTGVLGAIMDTLVAVGTPALLSSYPEALGHFLTLSDAPLWFRNLMTTEKEVFRENSFSSIRYGDHPMQVLHLMEPKNCQNKTGLVLFVHGGAWGSGRPWMYRLVARPFLEKDMVVAVLGYRTWPSASVEGQVHDIQMALQKLQQTHPQLIKQRGVTLMGHSSGAHIGLMHCLSDAYNNSTNVHSFVGISGVYCIPSHYEFETGRGVQEVSALKPACGYTVEKWVANSPTGLVQTLTNTTKDALPRILLLHGGLDTTVPYKSTLDLASALNVASGPTNKCSSLILPTVEHSETVLQLMLGGATRDVIMDWLKSHKT